MSYRDRNTSESRQIGFLPLLTLVFITLRLTGIIDWSWWLVLLPLYGPLLFFGAILGLMALLALIRAYRLRRLRKH